LSKVNFALVAVAATTSETSINLYQTKRRNIPEDNHLHNRRRENLKSLRIIPLTGFLLFTAVVPRSAGLKQTAAK
jgi:hypothetical protein